MGKHVGYVLRILSLCTFLSLLIPLRCNAVNEPYFFIIGDSLYDAGNNLIVNPSVSLGKCPFGMTFFHRPTGRFSDGRVVPDFIATDKLNLPFFIPPNLDKEGNFTYGANFASGGAAILTNQGSFIDLPEQYENFVKLSDEWESELGEAEAKRRLGKAVYLISMGGNDYFSYALNYANASFSQMQERVNVVIEAFAESIKDFYKKGARKFMFQNVSPLGCIPTMKDRFNITEGCARPPLTLAVLHNAALPEMAESIKNSAEFSEFTYSIFDYYTLLGERIRVPEDYGFKVGGTPCYDRHLAGKRWSRGLRAVNCVDENGVYTGPVCTNPDEYVFFDDGHNTDELNRQLADQLWNGGPDVAYPYNLNQLFELDPLIKKISSN